MTQKRILHIDILRGLAILLVLGHHYMPENPPAMLAGPLHYWRYMGWAGVDLFFVLSGLLIGGILFREISNKGSLDVRRFLIRRTFKIWPAYLVYLFVLVPVLMLTHSDEAKKYIYRAIPSFLQLQNYFGSLRGHTWSLAVEEHFYLALPWLLLFLVRPLAKQEEAQEKDNRLRLFPWFVLGIGVFCLASRFTTVFLLGLSEKTIGDANKWTDHRMDELFFGVFLAYLQYFRPKAIEWCTKYRVPLMVAGPVVAFLVAWTGNPRESHLTQTIGYSLLAIGFGGLLMGFVLTPPGSGTLGKVLGSAPGRLLGFIGFYSYSIYLWHVEIFNFLSPFLEKVLPQSIPAGLRWSMLMSAYLGGCVGLGVFMSWLVERPSIAVRDRLFPDVSSGRKVATSEADANPLVDILPTVEPLPAQNPS